MATPLAPAATSTRGVRLRLLGPPGLERDGVPASGVPAKAVALLAYLAVAGEGQPQPRERVVDLLWRESLPEAARKNLRNVLWAVRRALGEEVVRVERDRLALHGSVWTDVGAFGRLAGDGPLPSPAPGADAVAGRAEVRWEEAVALYRGPLLADLALPEAPGFEHWLLGQRERLDRLHAQTLAALVDAYRARGRWADVAALADRATAQDPLQEGMARAAAAARARLGERAEALRRLDALREALDRGLGVPPLPETEALRAAITAGTVGPAARTVGSAAGPAVGPVPAGAAMPSAPWGPRPARPPVPGGPPAPPLLGRESELAALDAALAAASDRARVVLLAGELGIGKTRLWRAWSTDLPPDAVAVEGRCLEATQALPWTPLAELFATPALRPLFAPGSPVPAVWLAEVGRLLPDLRAARPDLPPPPDLPPEEERRRVFEALARCLLAVDARPLVVFVDDLHWADHVTLDWLDVLPRRLADRPLLLVGAYRPTDAPERLSRAVAGWERDRLVDRVAPRPLTDREAAEFVVALGGDPATARGLYTQSAGNPFFLAELARRPPGEGSDAPPAGLADLVRARLGRLPDAARQVLQAAAVLDPDLDVATLRRTAGRDEDETLDALDALLGADVLAERGADLAFAHPLVATVVRGDLSGARRAVLHRRAAAALEAGHADRPAEIAGRLADHWEAAGDLDRAAAASELAAERALAVAAPAEAAAFARRAVALGPTPARRQGLARALYLLGDLDGAVAAYSAATEGFLAAGDGRAAARARLHVANVLLAGARYDEVGAWVERAGDLGTDPDAETRSLAQYLRGAARAQADVATLSDEANVAGLEEMARLAVAEGLPALASRARFGLGIVLAMRGDLPGAVAAFETAAEQARAAGSPFYETTARNNAGYHALLLGDLPAARAHVAAGLALAQRYELALPLVWLYSTRGEIALAEGNWDGAEGWFRRGLAEAQRQGNREQAATYKANLGLAARGRGDRDGALAGLEEARVEAAALPAPFLQAQVDLWLAETHAARGDTVAADAALVRAEARLADAPFGRLRDWTARLRETIPTGDTMA